MAGHKHAALMALYAEHAKTHERPWELWQVKRGTDKWYSMSMHPRWHDNMEYRVKPVDPMQLARQNLTDLVMGKAAEIAFSCNVAFMPTANAPETYDELITVWGAALRSGGAAKLPVFDGNCDNTIYTSRDANLAFRAWHDWVHYHLRYDFSISGEAKTVEHQANWVGKQFGTDSLEYKLFLADTLGRVLYYNMHHTFPKNQLHLVTHLLEKH